MNNTDLSPLYVDLDGTFIKTDMLWESFLVALKARPTVIFLCFFWLTKGIAYLKFQLANFAEVSVELLPLNTDFYDYLLEQKKKNRKIILATASNEKYAKKICEQYDVFDSYISSCEKNNLKGNAKLRAIRSETDAFAYAGNSTQDFVLFEHAEESHLVNPTRRARRLAKKKNVTAVFDHEKKVVKAWAKQLRVHQWLKNLLVFVPLFVSGSFTSSGLVLNTILGFLSFSFLASATYIINDLLDLESDRSHPRKHKRPLASGLISIAVAKICAFSLLVLAFAIASVLSPLFGVVLFAYLVLTLSYSFKLKQYFGIDVITLASLYTIRVIAGASLLGITVSFWLLAFSMFVFFSLALVKRCAEVRSLEDQGKSLISGRDYGTGDYPILVGFGTASATLSVLTFCFYINNNAVTNQYQEPDILWLAMPALCYWLLRVWIKTHRGEMHDDPIVFSIRDRGSIITIAFIGLITTIAQFI